MRRSKMSMQKPGNKPESKTRSKPLRVGFLALSDSAPFVVAQDRGLFAKHGVEVELSREVGWATIREKIIYGELDAAHAPAPMLWSTHLGIESVPCAVLTALILNLNGNAITLSERLWQAGVRDAASLAYEARSRSGERKITFGVVFPFSSHNLLLRSWLRAANIDPDRDVRIVVVPPAQMFRNLAAGTIDGYCAGEPWNSLAVREKVGWCPAWSAASHSGHIEKVLMVTDRFALRRPGEHEALVSALAEACTWCDQPENREPLAELLSRSSYINQSARVIAPALNGVFDRGHEQTEMISDFFIFQRDDANRPTVAKARSLQSELVAAQLLPAELCDAHLPGHLFREDLYRQAVKPLSTHELVT
jgi:ABC-type nitrate/sulfonate/bicarbonate transport system substrate-binding protein